MPKLYESTIANQKYLGHHEEHTQQVKELNGIVYLVDVTSPLRQKRASSSLRPTSAVRLDTRSDRNGLRARKIMADTHDQFSRFSL